MTRQTVSNWENGKSYPELQILVSISDQFDVSLDTLLKEDSKMVQSIDKERVMGTIKHEKSVVELILLYFSDSVHRGTDIKIQGTISGRKKYSFLYKSAMKKCNF